MTAGTGEVDLGCEFEYIGLRSKSALIYLTDVNIVWAEPYAPLSQTFAVTVAKAPLTITADDKTKYEGDENPELTVSYEGFVNGEDATVLTTQPTVTTTATTDSPVGTYPITASGAESSNYEFTYVDGILTVETVVPSYNNYLTIGNVDIHAGTQSGLSFGLENEDDIIMVEFFLELPEGFEIPVDDGGYYIAELSDARSNRHTMEVSKNSEGLYHFLVYSSRNNAFVGNSGDLIRATIECADEMPTGTYTATVKNLLMSDIDKNPIRIADFNFNIEVVDYIMGDVNDDCSINGLDIVEMVDKIMDRPSDCFVMAAADFDGNGIINGMDLVEEVSLVMSQTAGTKARRVSALSDESNMGLSLIRTGRNGLALGTTSPDRFILSQFILEMSEGQRLTDITTDDSHTVAFKPMGDSRYMVLCYSLRNDVFGSNDDIVEIKYEGSGTVKVSDAMFVNVDRQECRLGSAEYGDATGIDYVLTFGNPSDIYSVSGMLIKKDATSLEGLAPGVYMVNGKKVLVK